MQQDQLDLDYYDMDNEELYGERHIFYDRETGEAYYYSLNGDKYYVEV